jgi:hypothetical protein
MQQLGLFGPPDVERPSVQPNESRDVDPEPDPIPALFRRADARPRPTFDRVGGWHQSSLELEFGPSPIPPEFEARLQIRMLVSGRIKARTFLAWLAASGHRLARLPRGHEVHRMLDALAPELVARRAPSPSVLVASLERAGLGQGALAVPAPPF